MVKCNKSIADTQWRRVSIISVRLEIEIHVVAEPLRTAVRFLLLLVYRSMAFVTDQTQNK